VIDSPIFRVSVLRSLDFRNLLGDLLKHAEQRAVLLETPTHLTPTLRARSSVSAHMYLQLTWRGRGQTEVPQEEL